MSITILPPSDRLPAGPNFPQPGGTGQAVAGSKGASHADPRTHESSLPRLPPPRDRAAQGGPEHRARLVWPD
jgi:hypothetical protein